MNKSSTQKALEAYKKYTAELENIPVELQVKDGKHAKSKEVMDFCIKELSSGTTWDALRKKLGVGPSYIDNRWRVIRKKILDIAVPDTDESALKNAYEQQALVIDRIERLLKRLEATSKINAGSKNEHHFLKLEVEALKLLSEKHEAQFMQFVDMRKLKLGEKNNRGRSILFVINNKVPRPGDVIDVTETVDSIEGQIDE